MPLTGIANENEFYSAHYLDAVLKEDLKGVAQQWKEKATEGEKTPDHLLGSLRQDYFRLRENRLERIRDAEEQLTLQREFFQQVLKILGYEWQPQLKVLDDDSLLPVVAEVTRSNGTPQLWVLEGFHPTSEPTDILSLTLPQQHHLPDQSGLQEMKLEELLTEVFAQDNPPRWVILISIDQIVLIDRHKWNASRLLRFDLQELLNERDSDSLLAAATLLHREHTCPTEGSALLDELDENSHRHIYSVSEHLKFALREAIELLGNEALRYRLEVSKRQVYSSEVQQQRGEREIDPAQLKQECLRWVYRLLFIFYIEARPELGYVPMRSDVYREGYSLETLRDLEQVELLSTEDENGYYIDTCMRRLFKLLWEGYPNQDALQLDLQSTQEELVHNTFRLPALKSHLFDPNRTRMLNGVKFRNGALRRVLELMSLSRLGKGRRGRISYAQLGVNQLGEVYEGLLSLSAFLAEEDLYEVIKEMEPSAIKQINEWQKGFAKTELTAEQADYAIQLSQRLHELWESYAQELAKLRDRTTDPLVVWGQQENGHQRSPLEQKDKIYEQEKLSQGVANASAYRRLKLVMDYWCALWFWSIAEAEQLPTREEFLQEVGAILGETEMLAPATEQLQLFPETQESEQGRLFLTTWGFVDLNRLKLFYPRLQLVEQIAEHHRFFHWELEFADIFLNRGGFDLMVGNPPWIKVEWTEGGILGDYNPLVVLRSLSASKLIQERDSAFEQYPGVRRAYLQEYEEAEGTHNFLNAGQNYPLLKGIQTNLFKCFLPQAWIFTKPQGVSGFLHPEGVYDDPKGGLLRSELYRYLKGHFQFANELNLFVDVDHHAKFSINIYQKPTDVAEQIIRYIHIANLYSPKTVFECFESSSSNTVPSIKNDKGKWEIKGHFARIISVDLEILNIFAKLYDDEGTIAKEARLPSLHTQNLVSVLEKFAFCKNRLGNLQDEYYATVMFDETNAVKKDHTI